MERVVYCPSEEMLSKAESLAKSTFLSIVMGDAERLSDLQFDRTSVSVLEIPRHKEIQVYSDTILLGTHQFVYIVDEFIGKHFSNYSVYVNEEKLKPMYMERNSAKWCVPCNKIGSFLIKVFLEKEVMMEKKFDVHGKV